MRTPRGLTAEEAALWARLAETVTPIKGRALHPPRPLRQAQDAEGDQPQAGGGGSPPRAASPARPKPPAPSTTGFAGPPPRRGEDRKVPTLDRHGLDASWDRKLAQGVVQPDFSLDLHGHTVDAAHARLDHGLALALAQGARVVLLITGRERPSEDRRGRGVIRRKYLDWLASGAHASKIAAIRAAHPRHGGAGAVYIVLKRPR